MANPIELKMPVFASLFAALISAGAFMAIPFGPVPIVLQNMFVLMAGSLLGWRWGLVSVLIYLLAGALGFPVFSAGRGGMAHFLGPTGGYLVGYIPAVIIVGMFSSLLVPEQASRIRTAAGHFPGMLLGSLIVYLVGVSWFRTVADLTWTRAVGLGMIPFIPGDIIKIAAAAYIVALIRPVLRR